MITDNAIVSINNAWDKLVGLLNIRRDDGIKLGDLIAGSTTGPIDLYVETTGSDSNDGSRSKPLKTIQAALDRVPKVIRHPVNINVGSGTFAGMYLSDIDVAYAADAAVGAWLSIVGTLTTATETGLMTGNVTSGTAGTSSVWATMTKTGAGWTENALRGKFLLYKSGTGATTTPVCIDSNTSDTITIAGVTVAGAPNTTTVFEILDCSTIITSGPRRPSTPTGGSATQYGFVTCSGSTTHSSLLVQIRNMRFDGIRVSYHTGLCSVFFGRCQIYNVPTNTSALYSASLQAGLTTIGGCHYSSSASGTSLTQAAAPVAIQACVCDGAASNKCYTDSPSSTTSFAGGVSITTTSMKGFGTAVLLMGTPRFSCSGLRISNSTIGIDASAIYGACFASVGTGTIISGCTTAIKASRPNIFVTIISDTAGTGNTVAIDATLGAQVGIASTVTLTGTTELSVDGSAFTLAAMRAATPKYCTDATIAITGTKVFGT